MLEDLDEALNARGTSLVFAELKDPVRRKIERYGLDQDDRPAALLPDRSSRRSPRSARRPAPNGPPLSGSRGRPRGGSSLLISSAAAEQQRHGEPAQAVHHPRPERHVVKPRLVVQEREAKAPGEQPVGGDLIADHGARPGKVAVGRRAQRLARPRRGSAPPGPRRPGSPRDGALSSSRRQARAPSAAWRPCRRPSPRPSRATPGCCPTRRRAARRRRSSSAPTASRPGPARRRVRVWRS